MENSGNTLTRSQIPTWDHATVRRQFYRPITIIITIITSTRFLFHSIHTFIYSNSRMEPTLDILHVCSALPEV